MNNQSAAAIHHFSHHHPLHLSNLHLQPTQILPSCSGCKLKASGGLIYCCQPCNYFLHISCSQKPQQITHPFDQNHVLSLLPIPIYPGGLFNCDACGKQSNGFSYHCNSCNIDLHITCASMALSLNHPSHHHQLNLTFSPPYVNKSFSCDICKNLGSNHWLYRCNMCEFDAHLECAIARPTLPVQEAIQRNQMQNFQTTTRAIPMYNQAPSPMTVTQFAVRPPIPVQSNIPNAYTSAGFYGGARPAGGNGLFNNLLNQAIQGLFSGAGQGLTQSVMGGGGDGGGGDGGFFSGFGDGSSGGLDGGWGGFASIIIMPLSINVDVLWSKENVAINKGAILAPTVAKKKGSFCKLPYVNFNAKECPACKAEVTDTNVPPIYGNGDGAESLSSLSSALNFAERLVKGLEEFSCYYTKSPTLDTVVEINSLVPISSASSKRRRNDSAAFVPLDCQTYDTVANINLALPRSSSSSSTTSQRRVERSKGRK
ncbi:DC1 [Dillenia turbinata]|uniref:DC1 n=1 Tax=Dillenia turbinata TaxID=194707 RepID=A0AAN8Z8F5_9MAGN